MKVFETITELIGKTPLVSIRKYAQAQGLDENTTLLAKVEFFNPGGSSKDRIAWNMVQKAVAEGKLTERSVIIEPTSGNTGIGLAMVGAACGWKTMIVMPDSMSIERQLLMKAYGAELVLTPGKEGMTGAVKKAEEIAATLPEAWIAGQFDNPANPEAHMKTTGPEIWEDTDGKIDVFVAGVGTGGTLTGVGRYLKAKNPSIQIIGVEPAGSPLLTEGKSGPHGIMGIGANFVPSVLDRDIYDDIITVTNEEAYEAGRALAETEGLLVGISSGAAAFAAAKVVKRPEFSGKTVVAFLPDSGERYLSTPMF